MSNPAYRHRLIVLFFGFVAILPSAYAKHDSWQYAALPGLEVLSSAPDKDMGNRLHDFLSFRRAVETIWPGAQALDASSLAIVFCGRDSQYEEFFPNAYYRATMRFGYNALVLNLGAPQRSNRANAVKADVHMMQSFYTQAFLHRLGKQVPPWLQQGLGKFFRGMLWSDEWIGFPALTTDGTLHRREAGKEEDLQKALQKGKFLTFEELFAVTKVPHEKGGHLLAANGRNVTWLENENAGTWPDECYEFVHMCLLGAQGKYRQPFIKFAQMASNGPVDEAAFREAFGMGYHDMLLELWRYTAVINPTGYKIEGPDGGAAQPLPEIQFRDATAEEVSHIKAIVSADKMNHGLNAPRR